MKLLTEIQQQLKAPKNQHNKFGNYDYRSCEDILTAVKPFLKDATLILTDEIIEVGGRVYIKATATLKDGKDQEIATAWAREPEQQKGMNEAQITGSASSYARKYALNGLFLIDDNKDADHNNGVNQQPQRQSSAAAGVEKEKENMQKKYAKLLSGFSKEEQAKYKDDPQKWTLKNYVAAYKKLLTIKEPATA